MTRRYKTDVFRIKRTILDSKKCYRCKKKIWFWQEWFSEAINYSLHKKCAFDGEIKDYEKSVKIGEYY